jgi:uncharacterized protein YdeI (YjbR/CyaY-like superfamily)
MPGRQRVTTSAAIDATFFATPDDFRHWLLAHHERARELWVGFHKRGTGRPSLTWPESVAEALCVGWIDGVRRRIDDERYAIRFTPRKPTSTWSTVNVTLMQKLIADGRVAPAGLRAFERRTAAKSGVYAYEQAGAAELEAQAKRLFRGHPAAWAFFQSQPAWYRKTAIWRIVSAKRDDTRARRLAELIDHCDRGRTIPSLTRMPVAAKGASRRTRG